MTKGDAHDPLRELERRIEAARRGRADKPPSARPGDANALALAWRVVLELVAPIVIGPAIGWAIDRWLGTKPWGMIILFFLGVGAGMMGVWRAVSGMGGAAGYPRRDAAAAPDNTDDED